MPYLDAQKNRLVRTQCSSRSSLASGIKRPRYLAVRGKRLLTGFAGFLSVAGETLPGQANQQDAAVHAAHRCRENVHTPCKNARATVPSSFLYFQASWRPNLHTCCIRSIRERSSAPNGNRIRCDISVTALYCSKYEQKVKHFDLKTAGCGHQV